MKSDGANHTNAWHSRRTNRMDVDFKGETFENMKKLAEEAGLTPEGLIEVVMQQFVDKME